MPFRLAFGLDDSDTYALGDADVRAFSIIFSEFEGNVFDIGKMKFKVKK